MHVNLFSILIALVALFATVHSAYIWPLPQNFSQGNKTVGIAKDFKIVVQGEGANLDILRAAANRYEELIINEKWAWKVKWAPTPVNSSGDAMSRQNMIQVGPAEFQLDGVQVTVEDANQSIGLTTDESYVLEITAEEGSKATIQAKTVYGAIHGLETLSQLVSMNKGELVIAYAPWHIEDRPRFPHRGIMIDVARNFLPVEDLKRTIDGMSFAKFNVLHLHLSDQTSYSLASEIYPHLREKSYDVDVPGFIYTSNDIKELVQYAHERAIRIIPEIEMPGHAFAMGSAFPDMLICPNVQPDWRALEPQPPTGEINISNSASMEIIRNIIHEVASWFPDASIHLGGDEVGLKCYKQDPKFQQYLNSTGSTVKDAMQNFTDQIVGFAKAVNKTVHVWQEVLLNKELNLTVPDVVAQGWTSSDDTIALVKLGHKVVASPGNYWYLDCGHGKHAAGWIESGAWCDPYKTWQRMYTYNPIANLTEEESKHVLGGEVPLFSEQVDSVNLDRMIWPRTAAAGEVLWSSNTAIDYNDPFGSVKRAYPRIQELRHRLIHRYKIAAEPISPLWCVTHMGWCDLPKGYEK
ncbi:uncharacterized protein VTP21DRAFT_10045 [Calcarisporiella thermophila]|uniref:uncharacterized protein n=1 Tax=Calcarisporiella thermophila TaxID=911321 RepID=UPI0037423AC3